MYSQMTIESLLPLVGSCFMSQTSHGSMPLYLYSVEALDRRGLPERFAAPLSLIFSGSTQQMMSQDNYLLEHAELGSLQLFLVPVVAPGTAPRDSAHYYQALLN